MSQIEINNTKDQELKKDYQILVPYQIIEEKINQNILEIKQDYKLAGFRKGKVPNNVIKKKYQASILAKESEKIINQTIEKIISENDLKLALAPKVDIKTLEEGKTFEFSISLEIFPNVPEIELNNIPVIKKEVKVEQEEINDFIKKINQRFRKWQEQEPEHQSQIGEAVNIDYIGKIDNQAFEGGTAKNHQLELGSKSFIDNFEEQLVGKKAGQEVLVKVKFPKEYHNSEYADKNAEFEVKINSILKSEHPILDDEFIKNNFGLENMTKLEEVARSQIENQYAESCKSLFKKELFDFFDDKYNFELPEGLVNEQFKAIWQEIEEELKTNPNKFKNQEERNKAEAENKNLAYRMVKNGVILSKISNENKITISNDDLINQINKKAANFPGQEKMIVNYYQQNPEAIQNLRGQILEEKTINFILENSNITTQIISPKEFQNLGL